MLSSKDPSRAQEPLRLRPQTAREKAVGPGTWRQFPLASEEYHAKFSYMLPRTLVPLVFGWPFEVNVEVVNSRDSSESGKMISVT